MLTNSPIKFACDDVIGTSDALNVSTRESNKKLNL
jgi:hypothetical protein